MKTINTIKFAQQIKSNLNSKEIIKIVTDHKNKGYLEYSEGLFCYRFQSFAGQRYIEIPETVGTLKSILKNIDILIEQYEWDKNFEECANSEKLNTSREEDNAYSEYLDMLWQYEHGEEPFFDANEICKGRTKNDSHVHAYIAWIVEEDHINEDMDLIPNLIEHGNNIKLSAPLHNEHYWEWVMTQPIPF